VSQTTEQASVQQTKADQPAKEFPIHRRRLRFLGLTVDDVIRYFFAGNAVVSIVVLALITLFLLKEGVGFFGQNDSNLRIYRKAGLEFVDIIKEQESGHTALNRYINEIRLGWFQHLTSARGMKPQEANAALADFDTFASHFDDAVQPLRGLLSGGPDAEQSLVDTATAIKTKFLVSEDHRTQQRQLIAAGKTQEASAVIVDVINYETELAPLLAIRPLHAPANKQVATGLEAALHEIPAAPTPELSRMVGKLRDFTRAYIDSFPAYATRTATWDYQTPIAWYAALSAFLFGREWLTASFWQDWYGILPLLTGSLMVSLVALLIAVPFGVGAAIYVNQLASQGEQRLIKPSIEFISAFPSVVLGFFGIAVLGELLRTMSGWDVLSWMPGFPFSERLNVLTAGCLLALIAIPTIFSLSEDALNNVPRAFRDASFALGATRMQTILRIIAPAALSGIISAVLLGFGRVIGETMVVLLCAGNRIAIPNFAQGLGVVTQPVHTMTGIIAQEMGEVVRGSIHYRALFMVGLVLFVLSLAINFAAQKIVARYRISNG